MQKADIITIPAFSYIRLKFIETTVAGRLLRQHNY